MIILLALGAVGWVFVTRRNPHVRELLKEGWVPLFAAMVISSGTGIVLDTFVTRYEGFALLAVVISGSYLYTLKRLDAIFTKSVQVYLGAQDQFLSPGSQPHFIQQRLPNLDYHLQVSIFSNLKPLPLALNLLCSHCYV